MQTLSTLKKILFVILADPKAGKYQTERDITELWNLVQSMGDAVVMDLIMQKGEEFAATYIGRGKAQEIAEYLKTNPIDIIILNGQLKPGQKFNLTKMYWDVNSKIIVWDRVDLILAIFSRHAHTTEAKLQIDLARMQHMGPSIFGMGMILSRQGGGVGTRGIGETNTELMKRHWKREIKRVTEALDKLKETRNRQIERRKQMGMTTISLVGYTNAGKTSLFNLLTNKKNFIGDKLFATLDSTVGEIYSQELGREVIISDTIGFIQNLPPSLIDAFASTLLESVNADIVLHVIDASDPDMPEKINTVTDILKQLEIKEDKIVLVYNKIDAVTDREKIKPSADSLGLPNIFVSTKTRESVDELLPSVLGLLNKKI